MIFIKNLRKLLNFSKEIIINKKRKLEKVKKKS